MTKLREIREDRGLTQAQLAERANTSQAQIDRLEKGERKLTVEWAKRLADPLQCHWTEVLGEDLPTPPDLAGRASPSRPLSRPGRARAPNVPHRR